MDYFVENTITLSVNWMPALYKLPVDSEISRSSNQMLHIITGGLALNFKSICRHVITSKDRFTYNRCKGIGWPCRHEIVAIITCRPNMRNVFVNSHTPWMKGANYLIPWCITIYLHIVPRSSVLLATRFSLIIVLFLLTQLKDCLSCRLATGPERGVIFLPFRRFRAAAAFN